MVTIKGRNPGKLGASAVSGADDIADLAAASQPGVVGGAINKVNRIVNRPAEWVGPLIMADLVGSILPGRVGKLFRWPWEMANTSFKKAGQTFSVDQTVGKVAQGTFNRIAAFGEGLDKVTGLGGWRAQSNENAAARGMANVHDIASRYKFADLPSGVAQKIRGAKDPATLAHLAPELEKVVADSGKALSKETRQLLNAATKTITHHEKALKWRNPAKAIKNMPATLGQAPIGQTVLNASFIAGSALGTLSVAQGFMENLASLKQMCADMTGKDVKEVSTVTLLTGTVPPAVAEARQHLLWEHGIRGSIRGLGLGLMVHIMFKKNPSAIGSMLGFGAPMLVEQGADIMMGNSILPIYNSIRETHKHGPLTAADYAAFATMASKELRAHKHRKPFAEALGKQYAAENISPADILIEAGNGNLLKRIDGIIKETETAAAAAPKPSMVERVTNGVKNEPAAVGKYTHQLNQQTGLDHHPVRGG